MSTVTRQSLDRVPARAFITPADVHVILPFTQAFGKVEPEAAATFLVAWLSQRDPERWLPFTLAGFRDFLATEKRAHNPFFDLPRGFRMLVHGKWIVDVGADEFEVTDEFILRCYLSGARLWNPLKRFFGLLAEVRRGS